METPSLTVYDRAMAAQISIDAMKQLKAHVTEYHLDSQECKEMRQLIASYLTGEIDNADR